MPFMGVLKDLLNFTRTLIINDCASTKLNCGVYFLTIDQCASIKTLLLLLTISFITIDECASSKLYCKFLTNNDECFSTKLYCTL